NGFLSEILRTHGYSTYAVGKWHLTPDDETHMAADRSSWPLGRGFDRWYGFHGGETHQFVPTLYCDNHSVQPPRTPAEGYHLTEDLVDHAIEYLGDLRNVDGDQPFFLYFGTGACHSPHHAPREWIERYRGVFDDGWDALRERVLERQVANAVVPPGTELSPRPPWVPAWDELAAEDQVVAARFMECFAGFLSHTDDQIGRLLAYLDETGDAENTIVVLVSDNGASAEGGEKGSINDARMWNGQPAGRRELRERIDELGGPSAHNNYPWGWTMAGNTPFRRWKREVHQGGIADPCIVRWPARLAARGEVRHQFTHAIDVLPTVLELLAIEPPTVLGSVPQSPLEGTSFAYLLGVDGADEPARHTTQHFEMLGSRGIYHDGWKAVTFKPLGAMYDDGLDPDAPFDEDVWELYRVSDDVSETNDLAAEHPEKLAELVALWWREARTYQVLPLDNRPVAALLAPRRPFVDRGRNIYWPNGALVPETIAVNVRNRSHRITASVVIEDVGRPVEGVLLAMGNVLGGWSFHVLDGRLRYVHNHLGTALDEVSSAASLSPGAHELCFDFDTAGDLRGTGRLLVDGEVVGEGPIEHVTLVRYSITGGGITCGWEQGPPVGPGYDAPFRFTHQLRHVVVEVDGAAQRDHRAEVTSILSEQ
ncbi:MAG: hypothetical protein QOE63_1423, partial [Acidimicrobiaceae bacterium]